MRINYVQPGLIAEWNITHPDNCVRRWDMVVSVNGDNGEALIREIHRLESLNIVIRKRVRFQVRLTRSEKESYGLGICHESRKGGQCNVLAVAEVSSGVVELWNGLNPGLQICVG